MHALKWPDYKQRYLKEFIPRRDFFPCYAKKIHFIMEPDGKFYPCCQQVDMFPATDFREVGVEKAFENINNKNECLACYAFFTMHDYNLLVHHDLMVWWNYVTNIFMERTLFKNR